MIDDSFYFGVEEEEETDDAQQFPAMYPFSATVPEIGLALLKVRYSPPIRRPCLSPLSPLTHCFFLNVRKAYWYDRVWKNGSSKKLLETGIRGKMWRRMKITTECA